MGRGVGGRVFGDLSTIQKGHETHSFLREKHGREQREGDIAALSNDINNKICVILAHCGELDSDRERNQEHMVKIQHYNEAGRRCAEASA